MSKYAWTVLAALLVVAAVGCPANEKNGGENGTAGGVVGVVDLDRVAAEIGHQAKFREFTATAQERAQAAWNDKLAPMQKDLEKLRKDLSDLWESLPKEERDKLDYKNPSLDDARKKVADKTQQIQTEFNGKRQTLAAYQQTLRLNFAAAIQPALQSVCSDRAVRVLVPKQGSVYAAPGSDVSDDLIDYLKANPIPGPVQPPTDF